MGANESTLTKHGYTLQSTEDGVVLATSKEGERFVIREVQVSQLSDVSTEQFNLYFERLKNTNHPHIVSHKKSFIEGNTCYIVSDHCQGGDLAEKIKEKKTSGQHFEDNQILQWIVQICMALKYIHGQGLLYKDLAPQRIFLTEFGTIRLGEFKNLMQKTDMKPCPLTTGIIYLAPEYITNGIYNEKSDIWSLGCVLYELCTLELAFTAKDDLSLIPKINGGPYPTLPQWFREELQDLLKDMFQRDPHARPTASEILERPFIVNFLMRKCKDTTEELNENLKKLRDLADGLEYMHKGTTIGSLTGGVIGAAGGITSIVGLILAPFTLGASLIVTGVGIGVAVAGGATAGASNITNMVKQSGDRQAVRRIIKELEEKVTSVVTWLQEVGQALEKLKQNTESPDFENGDFSPENLGRLAARAGRGLGGISELIRLIEVVRFGNLAAQTAGVVRVAEVATGVFSALFVAVDVFFIAMDARELHRIREASELQGDVSRVERSGSRLELLETDSASEPLEPWSDLKLEQIRSETMKFVMSIRQKAKELQEFVDDLRQVTSQLCDHNFPQEELNNYNCPLSEGQVEDKLCLT